MEFTTWELDYYLLLHKKLFSTDKNKLKLMKRNVRKCTVVKELSNVKVFMEEMTIYKADK